MKIKPATCVHCLDRGCDRCQPLRLSRRSFFFFGSILAVRPEIVIPETTQWYESMFLHGLARRFYRDRGTAENVAKDFIVERSRGWVRPLQVKGSFPLEVQAVFVPNEAFTTAAMGDASMRWRQDYYELPSVMKQDSEWGYYWEYSNDAYSMAKRLQEASAAYDQMWERPGA